MYNLYYKLKGDFKLEKEFTRAFLKEFQGDKKEKGWAFKISDIVKTMKPFDWLGCNEYGVFFCEVKIIESNVFKFSQLRANQFTALERITLLSQKYNLEKAFPIVMVYSLKYKHYRIIDFKDILKAIKKGKNEIRFLF